MNIACCASPYLAEINSICCKPTSLYIFGIWVNGDESIFLRKLNNQTPLSGVFGGRSYKERVRAFMNHCGNDATKFRFPERVI